MKKIVLVVAFLLFTSTARTAEDTTPPELVDFNFAPNTINVSSASQDVTFTMQITDDLSGVYYGKLYFQNHSGGNSVGAYVYASDRISGDQYDGVYQGVLNFT